MDTAGKIHFGIYNGSVQSIGTSTAFNDGLWHRLTAQVSSAGMKLFIDGILSASNAGYTTPENYNGYWRIGYDNMTGWPNPPNTFISNQLLMKQ